jgi:hypothetical protein
MFACCTSKFVLDSVDAGAVTATAPAPGPTGEASVTSASASGCTGPNCQGVSGCVNKSQLNLTVVSGEQNFTT